MGGMAKCAKFIDLQFFAETNNRTQCFGSITEAPRVLGKNIASHCSGWSLEAESSAAQQALAFKKLDAVRTSMPCLPFFVTEIEKPYRVVNRVVARPCEKPGNVRISRVASVYDLRVRLKRSAKN